MKESKKKSTNLKAPEKLMILVTIVERKKADFYMDVLTGFEVKLIISFFASHRMTL